MGIEALCRRKGGEGWDSLTGEGAILKTVNTRKENKE